MKFPNKTITIIVAASENNAIGKNNDLIWDLPNDLKRFKKLTSGHCIIMGRKTFDSFPGLLPNRKHIIISNKPQESFSERVTAVNNLDDAIKATGEDDNPYIIGGGQIYKLL
jgi:dihydrofolate reductase